MRTLWKAVLLAALAIALVAVFAPPGALATNDTTNIAAGKTNAPMEVAYADACAVSTIAGLEYSPLLTVAAGAATNAITDTPAYAADVGVAGTSVMMTAIGVPQALRQELAEFTNFNPIAVASVMKHPIVVAVVRAIDATPSMLGVPNRGVCPNAAAAFARA